MLSPRQVREVLLVKRTFNPYTVLATADFDFLSGYKYPRQFLRVPGYPTSAQTFFLRAIFANHEDALAYGQEVGRVGSFRRTLRLSQDIQDAVGNQYKWGVWVREVHTGTLAQIEVVG